MNELITNPNRKITEYLVKLSDCTSSVSVILECQTKLVKAVGAYHSTISDKTEKREAKKLVEFTKLLVVKLANVGFGFDLLPVFLDRIEFLCTEQNMPRQLVLSGDCIVFLCVLFGILTIFNTQLKCEFFDIFFLLFVRSQNQRGVCVLS